MAVKRKGSLANALKSKVPTQSRLRVGFIDSATYPNGTNVATVAFWNEYGTDTAPPRPFMRNTAAQNKDQWVAMVKALYQTQGAEKALLQLGEVIQGDISTSITSFNDPRNADYTIKKKGFNAPLRDTMLMARSISYELSDDRE